MARKVSLIIQFFLGKVDPLLIAKKVAQKVSLIIQRGKMSGLIRNAGGGPDLHYFSGLFCLGKKGPARRFLGGGVLLVRLQCLTCSVRKLFSRNLY